MGGSLQAQLTYMPAPRMRLTVMDRNGNTISDSATGSGTETAQLPMLPPGFYVLRVQSPMEQPLGRDYALSVRSGPLMQMCAPDMFDPNGSAMSAAHLMTGGTANARLCAGEQDWFSYDFRSGAQQLILPLLSSGSATIQFDLVDVDGVTVLATASPGSMPILFSPPATGRYFIRVTDVMPRPMGDSYSITVIP